MTLSFFYTYLIYLALTAPQSSWSTPVPSEPATPQESTNATTNAPPSPNPSTLATNQDPPTDPTNIKDYGYEGEFYNFKSQRQTEFSELSAAFVEILDYITDEALKYPHGTGWQHLVPLNHFQSSLNFQQTRCAYLVSGPEYRFMTLRDLWNGTNTVLEFIKGWEQAGSVPEFNFWFRARYPTPLAKCYGLFTIKEQRGKEASGKVGNSTVLLDAGGVKTS